MSTPSRRELPDRRDQALAVRRLSLAVATLVVVGVLVQAALAGRHIGTGAPISLHGVLGNAVFALQLVVVGLLLAPPRRPSWLVMALVLVIMLASQIGLGYAGRSSSAPVAWHVGNGVAVFGLAAVQLSRLSSRSDERR